LLCGSDSLVRGELGSQGSEYTEEVQEYKKYQFSLPKQFVRVPYFEDKQYLCRSEAERWHRLLLWRFSIR
jgi:hypothetical protein